MGRVADRFGISVPVIIAAFCLLTGYVAAGYSQDDCDAMFFGTANRVYRLGL